MIDEQIAILIVDDDTYILDFISRLLRDEGYHILTAASPALALRLVAEQEIDIVLSDIKMPGMSGVDLLERIHLGAPDLPVILMTAYADLELAIDAIKRGTFDFINKPFKAGDLIRSLEKAARYTRLVRLERDYKGILENDVRQRTRELNDRCLELDDLQSDLIHAFANAIDAKTANLNGAAREQDAGFYQIQAGLSGSLPLSRQTRLFASVLGNWRDNIDSRFVDQASVVGTVGIAHSLANGDVISGSAQGQRFWLGRNGFRTSTGGDVRYTKRLADDRALSFSGQFFRLNYDGNPLLDADRFSASITYADKAIFGGIGGGKEETRRAGADQFSFAFVNAQLGVVQYFCSDRIFLANDGRPASQLRAHQMLCHASVVRA